MHSENLRLYILYFFRIYLFNWLRFATFVIDNVADFLLQFSTVIGFRAGAFPLFASGEKMNKNTSALCHEPGEPENQYTHTVSAP